MNTRSMLTGDLKKVARRTWTVPQAFQFCEHLAHDHLENFPVASLLVPREKRPHVYAIYSFARVADDYADEPGLTPAERVNSIAEWEEQLIDAYRGHAHHPVFVALRETIDHFEIPVELFQSLLRAFRSDVTRHRYESFEEVLEYCENSANPIGRLMLLLFNYRSETTMEFSDSICTALQLTNFWQDVAVDLKKDRMYIPLEDIREFGYSEEELLGLHCSQAFKDLMCYQVERTEQLFQEGKPLLSAIESDLRMELKLTWKGGMRILKKIEQQDYDVLARRPSLSLLDKTSIFLSSLVG
ncbi:MAG: squalene synthase HpnC [Ignavibacteriales bacterium]|nr:squalene synthase HpnC [Ignavibacteriales bacterium]